jgi:hypothetical protein
MMTVMEVKKLKTGWASSPTIAIAIPNTWNVEWHFVKNSRNSLCQNHTKKFLWWITLSKELLKT